MADRPHQRDTVSGRPSGRAQDRLLASVLAHRRLVLAAWLLVALAAIPGILRLGTDNSPSVYFVDDSPALTSYRELQRSFTDSEPVRLLVTGDGLWTRAGLERLGELERRVAEEVPYAIGVFGLAGHVRVTGGQWPPPDPTGFRERVLASTLDRQLGLVGAPAEGTGGDLEEDRLAAASILVSLTPPDSEAEVRAMAALEELAVSASGPAEDTGGEGAFAVSVVGMPVIDQALDASSREIGRVYFPLLIALAVLLLAAALRSVRGVVLPLVFVAVPESVLLGGMGYLGIDLNLVLAVLPPLLFVISLATAVHLMLRLRDAVAEGAAGDEAIRDTYRDKGWSVFWTGVTTMIGFGSLAISRVGPVPTLGVASATGIALMTLAAFTLFPALLAQLMDSARGGGSADRPRVFEARFRRLGRAWAHRAARRRKAVLAGAAVLVAAALAGVPRLEVESNAVRFLPPDHPAREGIERLEARGMGAATVDVLLTLPEEDGAEAAGFEETERLAVLEELAADLRELPRVLGAVGGGDVFAAAHRAAAGLPGPFGSIGSPAAASILDGLFARPVGRQVFRSFVAPDGRTARVTVFVEAVGYRELEPTLDGVDALAREAATTLGGARAAVTGQFPLMLETHRRLLTTLALSLTLTTLAVGLLFRWLLPSTRLALLALAPNLWPVVLTVGAMGWTGVPLDTATVMVASVVLGLAVDDTIHTLGHFRELAPRLGRLEAVAATLERTAPAFVLTGAILAVGFGVCALSEFAPTARFGGLSALAIALAVVGDLFLLPALLGSTPRTAVERLGRS